MTFKLLFVKMPAVCGAVLLSWGAGSQAAPAPPTNRPPAEVTIPKSIFVTNDVAGKDPFFPNSTRTRLRAGSESGQGEKKPGPVDSSALRLRGITTDSSGQRIALINTRTFAKGEVQELNVEGTKIRLRCVEIREKSVVVAIEGQSEQHELVLPEKLLPTSKE
jgi:hypothetical protein